MEPTLTLEMIKTDKQFGSDPSLVNEVKKAEQALRFVKDMIESGNVSELYTEDEVAEIIVKLTATCPYGVLNYYDEFMTKCCGPCLHPEEPNKECWIKWLKFRKGNKND